MIYFAQIAPFGPIKIGTTACDVAERIATLQGGCPWKIRALGWVDGECRHESWLHRRFASSRMEGEWFEPTLELQAAITEILRPGFIWPENEIPAGRCEALARAIAGSGGVKALGDKLGISYQAIVQWRRVPSLRALQVERHSGISRHELRPDLYPLDAEAAE